MSSSETRSLEEDVRVEQEARMVTSAFERLAGRIRVSEISEAPVSCVEVDPTSATIAEILQDQVKAGEHSGGPILLRTDQEFDEEGLSLFYTAFPYGVLFPKRAFRDAIDESEGGERFLDLDMWQGCYLDEAQPHVLSLFSDKNVLPASVTLWDLLTSPSFGLSDGGAALVLTGIGEYGVVTLDSLLTQPAAQACWLLAVLELERAAIQVCKRNPTDSLDRLPPERRKAARDMFLRRLQRVKTDNRALWLFQQVTSDRLRAYFRVSDKYNELDAVFLDYTMFADKKIMISRADIGLRFSKTKILEIFKDAENIRNFCAHPTPQMEQTFRHFGEFRTLMMNVHDLTQELLARE